MVSLAFAGDSFLGPTLFRQLSQQATKSVRKSGRKSGKPFAFSNVIHIAILLYLYIDFLSKTKPPCRPLQSGIEESSASDCNWHASPSFLVRFDIRGTPDLLSYPIVHIMLLAVDGGLSRYFLYKSVILSYCIEPYHEAVNWTVSRIVMIPSAFMRLCSSISMSVLSVPRPDAG